MKLLLVRHGESTWNVQGRYQGRLDPPLSALGEKQAKSVAQRFARDRLVASFVSSPLTRCRRTAEIIIENASSALRQPIELSVDVRFTEISHGAWEGLLKEEVEKRWPAMLADWRTRPESVTFPGGESLADVRGRWRPFARAITTKRKDQTLVAVTHDAVIRVAVLEASRRPLSEFAAIVIDNGSVTMIEFDAGESRVIALNDTTHLGPLRSALEVQAL